ncbi:MAG: thiamine phosphate synthase [Verrucomicrobia bacterium]|nr:thiamine phosphate synthase [Verrucomicrobiota bacterium]
MKPLSDCRLYAFVDTAYLRGRDAAELARQLCDGGADLIQLRAKGATPDQLRKLADALLPVTQAAGAGLVINDHPKLALQVGAPVCHLGQEDFFDAGYRTAAQVTGCPKQVLLGLSTHTPEQAQRALKAGPDYIAIGPVFATPTKPGRAPVTLDLVRWAAAPKNGVAVPWFAIGGINLRNLDEIFAAGARRIAVVSAILDAPDVAAACREFKSRLDAAGS